MLIKFIINWDCVGWLCFTSHRQRGHFKDGTPIYSPLWRTWSSVFTPFPPGIEPRAVAWQSITLPLRHTSSSWAYVFSGSHFKVFAHREEYTKKFLVKIQIFKGQCFLRIPIWTKLPAQIHFKRKQIVFTKSIHENNRVSDALLSTKIALNTLRNRAYRLHTSLVAIIR